jgi:fatty-acyl-CoA synthase
MQDYALTLDKFIDHAAKWHGTRTITTAVGGTAADRTTYAEVRTRSNRLSGALLESGL